MVGGLKGLVLVQQYYCRGTTTPQERKPSALRVTRSQTQHTSTTTIIKVVNSKGEWHTGDAHTPVQHMCGIS
jgi:hypothetical protein